MATVRSQMDEEAFETARAEGRKMTFEAAVGYALKEGEASTAQAVSKVAAQGPEEEGRDFGSHQTSSR